MASSSEQIKDVVSARLNLPHAAAEPLVLGLRDTVAACVDANTSPTYTERAGLTRTRVEGIVTDMAAVIDVGALEEALRSGACEVVDFDTPLPGDGFYEGVDVQPGHIMAGLPAPRPGLTGRDLRLGDRWSRLLLPARCLLVLRVGRPAGRLPRRADATSVGFDLRHP